MSDPYRAAPPAAKAAPARERLPEAERSPLRLYIRARAWSDGSTELHFGEHTHPVSMVSLSVCGVALMVGAVYCAFEILQPGERSGEAASAVIFALLGLWLGWTGAGGIVGGERIVVTPAALLHKMGRWRRPAVVPLDDISSVVVTGSDGETRVDVQVGRRTQRILEKVGYSEEQLRWSAQRLRRALDHARAARSQKAYVPAE